MPRWLLAPAPAAPHYTVTRLPLDTWYVDSFHEGAKINNAGQAIGNSDTAAGPSHAFLWEKGVMTDLGGLGTGPSFATQINPVGQVVGTAYTGLDDTKPTHAFLWEKGQMVDLNLLIPRGSEWTWTSVVSINDLGQIVVSGSKGQQSETFLLTPGP